jgi:Anabaena sensory rhodopsin transducer
VALIGREPLEHPERHARVEPQALHGRYEAITPERRRVPWYSRIGIRPLWGVGHQDGKVRGCAPQNFGGNFSAASTYAPIEGQLLCSTRRQSLEPRFISWKQSGRRRWAIAEGYIPSESAFTERVLIFHETACILNARRSRCAGRDHHLFADREPAAWNHCTAAALP